MSLSRLSLCVLALFGAVHSSAASSSPEGADDVQVLYQLDDEAHGELIQQFKHGEFEQDMASLLEHSSVVSSADWMEPLYTDADTLNFMERPNKQQKAQAAAKAKEAIAKAKSAKATRPSRPASDRLSAASQEEKWQRFLSSHPKVASLPRDKLEKKKAQFFANRHDIVKTNDKINSVVFKSSGPFASHTKQEFKKILNAASPSKYFNSAQAKSAAPVSFNLNVPAKQALAVKFTNTSSSARAPAKKSSRLSTTRPSAAKPSKPKSTAKRSKVKRSLIALSSEVEQPTFGSGAGQAASAAGGSGAIAGSKGGSAGGAGQIAGSKGGDAGGSGAIAGSKGGDSGGNAGIAGSKGGQGSHYSGSAPTAKGSFDTFGCTAQRTYSDSHIGQQSSWAYTNSPYYAFYSKATKPNIDHSKYTQDQYVEIADKKITPYVINLLSYCGGKDPTGKNPCGEGSNVLPSQQALTATFTQLGADAEMIKIALARVNDIVKECGVGFLVQSSALKPIDQGGDYNIQTLTAWLLKNGVPQLNIDQLIKVSSVDRKALIGYHVGLGQVNDICGACWAHATLFALTQYKSFLNPYSYNVCDPDSWTQCTKEFEAKYGPEFSQDDYSPQQILNCVHTTVSQGCSGGSPMDALDWLKTNGIGMLEQFPLTPNPGACVPANKGPAPSGKIMSWGWSMVAPACTQASCPKQGLAEYNMVKNLITNGGVMIAYVDATMWQYYSYGMFPINMCSNNPKDGNHVVIISALIQNNGVPSWIIANSWGDSWGQQGMIWLPFGVNACGIANFVIKANPPPQKALYEKFSAQRNDYVKRLQSNPNAPPPEEASIMAQLNLK